VLTRQWNLGHLLLGVLLLATLALGWRALQVAREPLPVPPPFSAPPMADRALLSRLDPFFPVRADAAGSLPVTALPISLHGVRADSATGRGSAIIASADGVQKVFAVGETIADGVTLAAIAADHVVIDRGGTREALWLDIAGGEAVQRFDPTASDPIPQPAQPDADGNMVPPSDAPAPAPRPSDMQGGAAVMPAVPQ
jgi:general secretion pathway protein C